MLGPVSSRCAADARTGVERFLELSGAPILSLSEAGVEADFLRADMQVRACWSGTSTDGQAGVGPGRYWQLSLRTDLYAASLRPEQWAVPRTVKDEFRSRWTELPAKITGGLCAPQSCTAGEAASVMLPSFLQRFIRMDVPLPPPEENHTEVIELSHWSLLWLDFVVAGVNSCGTTSLQMGLSRHDDIGFTSAGEDDSLFRFGRLLPLRSEVQAFNQRWLDGRPRCRLRGLRHAGLFQHARTRHALASMPRLRVVVVTCDPLSRLEKLLFNFHICESLATRRRSSSNEKCWSSLPAAVADVESVPGWSMGGHLLSLRSMLGYRLHLLHQAALRDAPRETFNSIANFLGVSYFSNDVTFERHNVQSGQRSGLCGNESLVLSLKRHLAEEYISLQSLLHAVGLPVPEELRRRLSRCDRLDELRGDADVD